MAADISALCETIAGLTLAEAVEANKMLEEKYGIKAAAGGGMMMAAPGAAAGAAEKPAEKTEFTVSLDEVGAQKIQVIKVIREITGLGLKEAKDLVDGAPKPVKENIAKDQAEDIKKKLEAVGAKISLK